MNIWVEHGNWDPELFKQHGTKKFYPKGTCLFMEHQALSDIYLILTGRVRAYLLSPSGEERHLFVIGSNSIMGECNVWSGETYPYCAAASTDIEVIRIPHAPFREIVRGTPDLFEQVLQSMSQKQNALLVQTHLMSFSNIEERVMFVLAQLAETYGESSGDGVLIAIPFTHQELSQVVGSSRVSVSNVMLYLQEKGLISKVNKQYLIHSINAFKLLTYDKFNSKHD
ncbi:Crp/Fnr family transcriptional regulator [Neobacillus sp. OS1-2]|uniref:Crp/Fnr family transcriptional regulator n=1 Tax=Neobacillus sp. OS1-2 TaxID=3070680 RepID=UPI0027DF8A75|nr:Crp/Fnr family transcriptional regulator [Neobacillus sp. OS1-2]WML41501.1 Crp/Fnr family transcriptional regulator [Neobacillus sp. OS1-2]